MLIMSLPRSMLTRWLLKLAARAFRAGHVEKAVLRYRQAAFCCPDPEKAETLFDLADDLEKRLRKNAR